MRIRTRIGQVFYLLGLSAVTASAQTVSFQQYDTNAGTFSPLVYVGLQTLGPNGDMVSSGPTYFSTSGTFPYVMLDTARNLLLLSPGTFTTVQIGAVVTVTVPSAGPYDVSGAFARANDAFNAGDGVRVMVLANNNIDTPLFDADISSSNLVDTNSMFTGTGVAPFHVGVSLAQGDVIQFAVFSGPSLLDGTFDLTALKFTVSGGGTSIALPADFPSLINASDAPVNFTYTLGDPTPAVQTLPVTTVPSTLGLNVAVATTSGGAWLTASLSSAVSPAILTIAVNPSGLAAVNYTNYTGSVTVLSPGASNSLIIPVSLGVFPAGDGPIGVVPYLTPSDSHHKAVGFRYSFRVNANAGNTPSSKILFFARGFYNPNRTEPYGMYQIESNLYSYRVNYTDAGCLGWPPMGQRFLDQSGLWVSIPDYPASDPNFPVQLKGRIGVRPSDVLMFPRQNSGIDGIPYLSKIETISQTDVTGKDVSIELTRGSVFTNDQANWGYRFDPTRADNDPNACSPDLPSGFEYQVWHMRAMFDGQSYQWDFAMPVDQALYLDPNRMINIVTEFFEMSGFFQVYVWDFTVQDEGSSTWQTIKSFIVNYQNKPKRNTGSGVRLGNYRGNRVLEFSNDRTDTYAQLNDVLTLRMGIHTPRRKHFNVADQ